MSVDFFRGFIYGLAGASVIFMLGACCLMMIYNIHREQRRLRKPEGSG